MNKEEHSRWRDQLEQRSITGSFPLLSLWAIAFMTWIFPLHLVNDFIPLVIPFDSYIINLSFVEFISVLYKHALISCLWSSSFTCFILVTVPFFCFSLKHSWIHFSIGSSLTTSPRRFLPHYLTSSCQSGSLTVLMWQNLSIIFLFSFYLTSISICVRRLLSLSFFPLIKEYKFYYS